MLLSFHIQFFYWWQVVVRSSIALDVHAHGLEHFELVAFMVNLEDLCLVFLVETSHGVFWYQSFFGMSKIWVAVSDLIKTEVIILVVLFKTSRN